MLFCVVFAGDELSFQYKNRSPNSSGLFGSVLMQRLLAIELKGGKVEYTVDRTQPTVTQKCVYSLFPHAGYTPCWYLIRKSKQPIAF